MIQFNNFLIWSPGGENEGGGITGNNSDNKRDLAEKSADAEEDNEKKLFLKKVQDALQDWSNDDQREQDFDDTRP